jgi:hypothetical protein
MTKPTEEADDYYYSYVEILENQTRNEQEKADLQARLAESMSKVADLVKKNKTLKEENSGLKKENVSLKSRPSKREEDEYEQVPTKEAPKKISKKLQVIVVEEEESAPVEEWNRNDAASWGEIKPWSVVFKKNWPGSLGSMRKKQKDRVVELIEEFMLQQVFHS